MGKDTTYDEAVSGMEAYVGLTASKLVLRCCVFQNRPCVWHYLVFIKDKNIFGSVKVVYELAAKTFFIEPCSANDMAGTNTSLDSKG